MTRSLALSAALLVSGVVSQSQPTVDIRVDAGRPGPAISPFLYGQFIEHLGRCIHGGIWAEMLRDRKFLQEPGKSWQVVKPEGAEAEAQLDTAGAYAGEHCMALWARDVRGGRVGIRQGGLGLIAGREYVGYVVAASIGAPSPVEVRLSWGEGADQGQSAVLPDLGRAYRKIPLRFRAGATTDNAVLSVTVGGPAYVWLGCLSLMPADNVNGMRPDTLALIRKLAPPITRWPGGNFVSGYNWKDAIGDRDRRPPRWERAWSDVEDNDFGIDEFLAFCREVGTEPYVAVNTGLGPVLDAADEVEYANGSADTPWGRRRAANGHAKPYGVTWWGVGNEMFGNWQLGHVGVEQYALRHNAFVATMRARDAHIKVIAVGAPGPWNDTVLRISAGSMDMLSGHHYTERRMRVPFSPEDERAYAERFVEYSGSVATGVRGLVNDLRARHGKGHADVDRVLLAADEWGIVRDWNGSPDGPGIGPFEHYYTLGDAIATARALNELLRSADVVGMANWAQTVNVIGAIKTSRTAAIMDPAGHVMALYRTHLGGKLLPIRAGAGPVDAVAAQGRDGRIVVVLVNYSPTEAVSVNVALAGRPEAACVGAWRIDGPSLGATNVPGQPEQVETKPMYELPALSRSLALPPHSITLLEMK